MGCQRLQERLQQLADQQGEVFPPWAKPSVEKSACAASWER
jgi:hypothetical protein